MENVTVRLCFIIFSDHDISTQIWLTKCINEFESYNYSMLQVEHKGYSGAGLSSHSLVSSLESRLIFGVLSHQVLSTAEVNDMKILEYFKYILKYLPLIDTIEVVFKL